MTEPKIPALTSDTKKALFKAFLRTLPLVPGPELYDILAAARRSRESIDTKISQAVDSLKTASNLIEELEEGLKDRTEKLTTLREKVERYSKLAEVEEDKARAILTQLELTLEKGQKRERLVGLAINLFVGLLIFGLGIILSPKLTVWWASWHF